MLSRTSGTPPTVLSALAEQPHEAFYASGEPYQGEAAALDTGLRCWCGQEVVAVLDDPEGDFPTGWAHVGAA